MIKFPSLIKEYSAIYSKDPSLLQAPTPPADNATAEALAAYEAAAKEHEHKLKVARETGDYAALLVEGAGPPTLFMMRQLTADAYTRILYRGGTAIENTVLAFRYALRSVANWPGADVALVEHPELGQIASLSFFDKLGVPGAASAAIAIELGDLAIVRAGVRPS